MRCPAVSLFLIVGSFLAVLSALRGYHLTYTETVYYLAMDMVRFQMVLPPVMLAWLRAEADRRGVKMCEVLRSFVQREMDRK